MMNDQKAAEFPHQRCFSDVYHDKNISSTHTSVYIYIYTPIHIHITVHACICVLLLQLNQ